MMYTLVLLFTVVASTANHTNEWGAGATNINGYRSQADCEDAAQHLQDTLGGQRFPGKMYHDCIPQHTYDEN